MAATLTEEKATRKKEKGNSRARSKTRIGVWPLADGYLWNQTLGGFLRGFLLFVGLFFAFAVVTTARRMSEDSMNTVLALQFLFLQMPRIILFMLPASMLFGTVSTFGEMSSRGEITALNAGSMSLWRMLRAPLTLGAILMVFAFWLQEVVVPGAELQKARIAGQAIVNAKASQVFPLIDKRKDGTIQRTIQAENFDFRKKIIYQPLVQLFRADGTPELTISAEKALWNAKTKEWQFINGRSIATVSIRQPFPDGKTFSIPQTFGKWAFKTNVAPDPSTLLRGDRDIQTELKGHNFEMVSRADLIRYRQDQEQLLAGFRKISAPTADTLKKEKDAKREMRSAIFGYHDKLATPLVILALVLVGAPLAVRPQRTASPGLAMGLSIMVLLGYYMLWTLANFWGKAGGQQPVLAAYSAVIILGGVGAFMVWRKN